MYSLLLMSAMAGTPDTASFGWRTACHGCYATVSVGCTGCTGVTSCHGTTNCHGYSSCTGCTGATRGPLFPRLAARLSCQGSACHGSCYGSCYGSGSSCYGHINYGSCFGSFRGAGCMGNCYGSFYGMGCYGSCYGQAACYGHVVGATMAIDPIPQASQFTPGVLAKAATTLTVELPATATLFVDGGLIKGEGALRTFNTPELVKGQSFYYELKAEVVVNGKTETEEQRVIVRAGEPATATFKKLTAAVNAPGAVVASK